MLRRAVCGGWDLSAEQRRALVEHLKGVLRSSGRARDELAAVGCYIACVRANDRACRAALRLARQGSK